MRKAGDSVYAVWGEMVERNWLHVYLSSTVCASEFMQSNLNTSLVKSMAIVVVVQVATATVVVRRKSGLPYAEGDNISSFIILYQGVSHLICRYWKDFISTCFNNI